MCCSRFLCAEGWQGLDRGLGVSGVVRRIPPRPHARWYFRRRRPTVAFRPAASRVVMARRRRALALVYFIGYRNARRAPIGIERSLHPVQLITWYLIALGSMAAARRQHEHVAPCPSERALLATWLWLLASPSRPVQPLLLGWALFLFASTATIAIGRAPLGVGALASSRYRIYSEFLVLIAIVAVTLEMTLVTPCRIRDLAQAQCCRLPCCGRGRAGMRTWARWSSIPRRAPQCLDHYIATGVKACMASSRHRTSAISSSRNTQRRPVPSCTRRESRRAR